MWFHQGVQPVEDHPQQPSFACPKLEGRRRGDSWLHKRGSSNWDESQVIAKRQILEPVCFTINAGRRRLVRLDTWIEGVRSSISDLIRAAFLLTIFLLLPAVCQSRGGGRGGGGGGRGGFGRGYIVGRSLGRSSRGSSYKRPGFKTAAAATLVAVSASHGRARSSGTKSGYKGRSRSPASTLNTRTKQGQRQLTRVLNQGLYLFSQFRFRTKNDWNRTHLPYPCSHRNFRRHLLRRLVLMRSAEEPQRGSLHPGGSRR